MSRTIARDAVPWRTRLTSLGGAGLLRALAATWRYKLREGEDLKRLRREGKPFIFAFWHGQMLPFLWAYRNQGVVVLVSEHGDGELVAGVLARTGYRLIRGSTTRGGGRALLEVVRTLRGGNEVVITPDGPRGPARKFAPGAIVAAHRAGASLVPAAAHADRAWKLSSWDGFIIPKPFARVTIVVGTAKRVNAGSVREAAEEVPLLERLMEEMQQRACES